MIQKYRPDGSTALNIDMIVQKCINIANEYYGTKFNLTKNADRILIQADINSFTAQLIQILDTVCLTNNSANVNISVEENKNTVYITFECEGICNGMTLEFELYTGIPSNVISDKDQDAVLEKFIRDAFQKLQKINSTLSDNYGKK